MEDLDILDVNIQPIFTKQSLGTEENYFMYKQIRIEYHSFILASSVSVFIRGMEYNFTKLKDDFENYPYNLNNIEKINNLSLYLNGFLYFDVYKDPRLTIFDTRKQLINGDVDSDPFKYLSPKVDQDANLRKLTFYPIYLKMKDGEIIIHFQLLTAILENKFNDNFLIISSLINLDNEYSTMIYNIKMYTIFNKICHFYKESLGVKNERFLKKCATEKVINRTSSFVDDIEFRRISSMQQLNLLDKFNFDNEYKKRRDRVQSYKQNIVDVSKEVSLFIDDITRENEVIEDESVPTLEINENIKPIDASSLIRNKKEDISKSMPNIETIPNPSPSEKIIDKIYKDIKSSSMSELKDSKSLSSIETRKHKSRDDNLELSCTMPDSEERIKKHKHKRKKHRTTDSQSHELQSGK